MVLTDVVTLIFLGPLVLSGVIGMFVLPWLASRAMWTMMTDKD